MIYWKKHSEILAPLTDLRGKTGTTRLMKTILHLLKLRTDNTRHNDCISRLNEIFEICTDARKNPNC